MDKDTLALHYVCTREEAVELIDQHRNFWVSNCGCREGGEGCKRSRMDVCLFFKPDMGGTGSDFRRVNKKFAKGILQEAENKQLVTRPFRDEKDMSQTQGVCFCCDDCCGYFQDPIEKCDKGRSIEKTDKEACSHCGDCVDACNFQARKMKDEILEIDSEKCYGCALCLDVCPDNCITMQARL